MGTTLTYSVMHFCEVTFPANQKLVYVTYIPLVFPAGAPKAPGRNTSYREPAGTQMGILGPSGTLNAFCILNILTCIPKLRTTFNGFNLNV